MGMNEISEAVNNDNECFEKAVKRVASMTNRTITEREIIIELEKEIDRYREKIKYFEECNKHLRKVLIDRESETTTLEAVQDRTMSEIIKALADNGYNTITINCYKDNGSEV